MSKFVYSRVVVIREFVNAWAPDAPAALEFLQKRDDKDLYDDRTQYDHEETLTTSPWEFVSEAPGAVCAMCRKDILDRPVNLKPYVLCHGCFEVARSIQDKMLTDIVGTLISERHPTTPGATAHTEPPTHTPR